MYICMYIYERILEISKRRYRIFNRIFHFAACTRLQLAATGSNRVNNKVERENKIIREMIPKNNPRKSFLFFVLNGLSLHLFFTKFIEITISILPPRSIFTPYSNHFTENEQSLDFLLILLPLRGENLETRNHKIANRATR